MLFPGRFEDEVRRGEIKSRVDADCRDYFGLFPSTTKTGARPELAQSCLKELTTSSHTSLKAPSLRHPATRNEHRNRLNEETKTPGPRSYGRRRMPSGRFISPCPMTSSVVRENHPVTLTSGCPDGPDVTNSSLHFRTSCNCRGVSHRHTIPPKKRASRGQEGK
jgi:hypothetical protein